MENTLKRLPLHQKMMVNISKAYDINEIIAIYKFDYTSIDVSQIFYLIDLLVNSEDGKVPAPIPRQQIKGKCKSYFSVLLLSKLLL